MEILIWIGTALSLLGIAALLYCIKMVIGIRKKNLPEPDMRNALQKAVALNMAALGISGIGLMMVVIGVFLG